MAQQGHLFKRNHAWHLRFYRTEIVDGVAVRQRVSERLAPINDEYRSRKDLEREIKRALGSANSDAPLGGLSFADFYEDIFLPNCTTRKLKASTIRFYRDTFKLYLKSSVGAVKMRDFKTRHAQGVLNSIDLSHQTLLRIKTAMSAAFTVAQQQEILEANPIGPAKAEGKRKRFHGYAYTLAEIKHMLKVLDGTARTVVALAAFTGMREGEIRGLRWPDYSGDILQVNRAIWRTFVDVPKTEDSEAYVPVIKPLRIILDEHKRLTNGTDGYIFAGPKKNFALNLDNLAKRDIRPVLGERWHGYHAFRRGLTTNMFELGVPAEVSQILLRHADAETTRRHYLILQGHKQGAAAMKQLEAAIRKAKFGQQVGNTKKRKSNS